MGNNMSLNRKGISLLIYLAIGVLALSGCTTPSTQPISFDEAEAPVVESIRVNTAPEQIIVEIVNNKTAPYVTFQLMDPPKIILDIQGRAGANLPQTTQVNREDVNEIRIEEVETEGLTR
jgi:hypothetical protein